MDVCLQAVYVGFINNKGFTEVTLMNVNSLVKKANVKFVSTAQYISAALNAPSVRQAQAALFVLGVCILSVGLSEAVFAQGSLANLGNYNDTRIATFTNRVFAYIEGSMGALIMVAAGLGAIISAAFGQYRAALALLVVAVGAFILRSLVATFFNDKGIA